jgi:cyclic beta-1,2-glucan synthetase
MNRVGRERGGESVWMGWFLASLLGDWADLAESRDELPRAARWRAHRERLREALESQAWDGDWYKRGWYDDGTPLGSKQSDECRIDAWCSRGRCCPESRRVNGGARARLARAAPGLGARAADPAAGAPVPDTPHDPGYIKGYVAGVRENGGQYTHAALWVVRAFAELGRRDRAATLLKMLSPVSHSADPESVRRYQVEPYVVAADVYGVEPHVGRGGWTWYTGSSGWMYRVALESVLGVRLEHGQKLVVRPCIPDDWPGFTLSWTLSRHGRHPGAGAGAESERQLGACGLRDIRRPAGAHQQRRGTRTGAS